MDKTTILWFIFSFFIIGDIFAGDCPGGYSPRVNLDKVDQIYCLVRYHGFRHAKDYDPSKPNGGGYGSFVHYVETGEKQGERGFKGPLSPKEIGSYFTFGELKYEEKDLGLKFQVDPTNNGVSKNSCQVYGELGLIITDTKTGHTLGQTDVQLESLVGIDNGSFVGQITIRLPEKLIEEQLRKVKETDHLLTHVKFQCN